MATANIASRHTCLLCFAARTDGFCTSNGLFDAQNNRGDRLACMKKERIISSCTPARHTGIGLLWMHKETMRPAGRITTHMPSIEILPVFLQERRVALMLH